MLISDCCLEFYQAAIILIFVVLSYLLCFGKDQSEVELFYDETSTVLRKIRNKCFCLRDGYTPTLLWGKNGHMQSFIFAIIGRFGTNRDLSSKRYEHVAKDGSIVTYDVFTPKKHESGTLLVVPGICNHAENTYVKAFSQHMMSLGFQVVVFNHTGALKSVKLNRGKIFTYGHTEDLDFVVTTFREKHNVSTFSAAIGFSLGANILMKYLGEEPERQNYFQCATSICQGYDVHECNKYFQQWENFRRFYNKMLTRKMLKVILHHKDKLDEHVEDVNWKRVSSVTMLHELDKEFTIKMLKNEEDSIDEFYLNASSSQYMGNIRIPLLIVNAKDDPLIPEKLYKHPKKLAETNSNVLFVVTTYGGHMGYFEGGVLLPNKVSWMDRLIGEFVEASNECS